MGLTNRKFCPVCGGQVAGRSDKIYCSSPCRIMANNEKKKLQKQMPHAENLREIEEALASLLEGGGAPYVKIILLVTRVCKILYKFGG